MFIRPLITRSGVRSYSTCKYDYRMNPFGASMMTVSFCFLIGAGIRNDIGYLYSQHEEIKKMLKEIKEKKE